MVLVAVGACSKTETQAAQNSLLSSAEAFKGATGQFVINPQFDLADGFSEGLAAVKLGDDETGKIGFIDTQEKRSSTRNFLTRMLFSRDLPRY